MVPTDGTDSHNPAENLSPEKHGWWFETGKGFSPIWYDGSSFPDFLEDQHEEEEDDDDVSESSDSGVLYSSDSEAYDE